MTQVKISPNSKDVHRWLQRSIWGYVHLTSMLIKSLKISGIYAKFTLTSWCIKITYLLKKGRGRGTSMPLEETCSFSFVLSFPFFGGLFLSVIVHTILAYYCLIKLIGVSQSSLLMSKRKALEHTSRH